MSGIRQKLSVLWGGIRKKFHWTWILMAVFGAVFLFSGYKLVSELTEKQSAVNAYEDLRQEIQSAAEEKTEQTGETEPAVENPEDEPEETPEESSAASEEKTERVYVTPEFDSLQAAYPEIVAWIQLKDTAIDYPVMQSEDNSYYLTHMYNGQKNSSGSIFMDYRCSPDFTDRNTVLYGHNMKNGAMFCDLESYRNQSFYDSHPTMTIFTPDGNYTLELLAGSLEDGDQNYIRTEFSSDEDLASYVSLFTANSTFVSEASLQPGDRIVTLSTCVYDWDNARYVIIGRLVPAEE